MAISMAKLLKEAFKEAGIDLPKAESHPSVHAKQILKLKKPITAKTAPTRVSPASTRLKSKPNQTPPDTQKKKRLNTESYTSGMPGVSPVQAKKTVPEREPDFELSLAPSAVAQLGSESSLNGGKRINPSFDGRRTIMHSQPAAYPDLELKLGIDFGTSCTKIVIADPQQDKAFAVPFLDNPGISRYLLPGIVFKGNDYHFEEHGKALRDLKLSLLEKTVRPEDLIHSTAFLALAIRHARGWLFTEHATLYRKSTIAWTLCLGMPSDNPNDPLLKPRFELLGIAAWMAAGSDKPMTNQLLEHCLLQAEIIQKGGPSAPVLDLEIRAVPELAAQVYGHVASESFDPKGHNTFMMVDVGAGTVDSCLFHVHRDNKTKRWNFLMFTKAVEGNGSINLHRQRFDWWKRALQRFNPERTDLIKAIDNAHYRSDCLTIIPPQLEDYIAGTTIRFDSNEIHPDTIFLKKRLKKQVLFTTYAEARNQQHLRENDLKNMPTFLCGGGMRMPFYQQLHTELDKPDPSASWLKAQCMELSKPRKMLAPGLPSGDYDRLSVAYGLGMMDFGILEQSMGSTLPPRLISRSSLEGEYVSKDMM